MDREIIITNPQGLHARPASALVEQMKSFDAKVSVEVGAKSANAASIMSVLALGATTGNTARVTAEGADAQAALDAVELILTSEDD